MSQEEADNVIHMINKLEKCIMIICDEESAKTIAAHEKEIDELLAMNSALKHELSMALSDNSNLSREIDELKDVNQHKIAKIAAKSLADKLQSQIDTQQELLYRRDNKIQKLEEDMRNLKLVRDAGQQFDSSIIWSLQQQNMGLQHQLDNPKIIKFQRKAARLIIAETTEQIKALTKAFKAFRKENKVK